ncbi:sce7726 family protein [Pedobacter sp. P26]|uniref:sce7726 family protein n=1 Tax=Pedobacter sp. P26 TaxID=3423956 RepID=UPI003D66A8F0
MAKSKRSTLDSTTTSNLDQYGHSINYAISQIFNAALSDKIHQKTGEESIRSLIYKYHLYPSGQEWDLVLGLEIAYNYLKKYYRCEYVYKNEIANQLLLQYHDDNSATLLREVNSGGSIADVVIVNGSTTAYEIKTELDSFDRLESQITAYQYLFDFVYVVTYPKALAYLNKMLPASIGIIIFDNDGVLKCVKKPLKQIENFDPSKAGLTLRQSELMKAYKNIHKKLPLMGTALIHMFCYKWYLELNASKARSVFKTALKARKPSKHQFDLIKNCSTSLKMLFLSKGFSKRYCIETLNKLYLVNN